MPFRSYKRLAAGPAQATKSYKRGKYAPRKKSNIPRSIDYLEKNQVTCIRRRIFFDLAWDSNIGYSDAAGLTGSNFGFGINFQGNQLSINLGATPVSAQFWSPVGSGLNFNEIQDLFEDYMIDSVEMEVTCGTTARDNEATDNTFTKGQNPTILALIDYSDANAPTNISTMLQDADCKTINSFDSTRKLYMSVKPKWQQIISLNSQQAEGDVAVGQPAYNCRPSRGFLSTDTGALTDHYGLKVYCDPMSNNFDAGQPECSQMHRFMFTYHYKVRHTQ